jgi:nitrogen fixation protein NifU and related proteins
MLFDYTERRPMTRNAWRGKLPVTDFAPMYSPQLLDHFEHPRNSGELPAVDAQVCIENPACGDILELAVKMNAGRIAEIRFRAKGCVPAMACASAMTELAKGRSLQEAGGIGKVEVVDAVGGVPPASGHAAQLAIDALRAVLQKLG